MSGFTPGPWTTDPHYSIYVWAVDRQMVADLPFEPEEAWIARMRGVGRGATVEEQKANARLIAAAPDLLEALKATLVREEHYAECEHCGAPHGQVADLCPEGRRLADIVNTLRRAAISKARGDGA